MLNQPEIRNNTAKRLAMLASDQVSDLAESITGSKNYPSEITGAVLGLMPHVVEKAIIINTSVPGDISQLLAESFVNEFEKLVKITSNSGGFSNRIKKTLFNVSFHTMFRREYNELKPKINQIWESARADYADPVEHLAYAFLKYAESSYGRELESETSIKSVEKATKNLFMAVHQIIDRS